jgi:hypothetical protein
MISSKFGLLIKYYCSDQMKNKWDRKFSVIRKMHTQCWWGNQKRPLGRPRRRSKNTAHKTHVKEM